MRLKQIGIGASVVAGLALGGGTAVRAQEYPSQPTPPIEEHNTDTQHKMDSPMDNKVPTPGVEKGATEKGNIGDSAHADIAPTKLSTYDADFVKKANGITNAQIKLGQLAAEHASSTDVKDLAKKFVDDNTKAKDDLKTIADRKGITLSEDLSPADQQTYNKLSKLSGKEFDDAYVAATVKDLQSAVPIFMRATTSSKDEDLKSFAQRTLPTLRADNSQAKRESQKM
jgi:putative membrane protein